MSSQGAATPASPRARAESILSHYPDITAEELAELKRWFTRHASALDVGMIAGDERLAPPYRRFAQDHLQRLSLVDYVVALGIITVIAAVAALIIWYSL